MLVKKSESDIYLIFLAHTLSLIDRKRGKYYHFRYVYERGGRERERDKQTGRQAERQRQTETERYKDRQRKTERERESSDLRTLLHKD